MQEIGSQLKQWKKNMQKKKIAFTYGVEILELPKK